MSFLFGGGGSSNKAPKYTSVQIQTSVNTLCIPVVYGTGPIAPNLIWYGDFAKHQKKVGGGGKGGVGGKGGTQTDYTASLVMALCEGPIDSIGKVLVNQGKSTLSGLGMSLIAGSYPTQTPWTHLTHAHPADAFGYPGTALIVSENYDLGFAPNVPNHNFEVIRVDGFEATWCTPGGIKTADMGLVIEDFFSNEQYGVPGFADSFDSGTLLSTISAPFGGDASLQTYLRAQGIGMCPFLTSQETASSILQRWLTLCNCEAVWSGSKLKFVPYGDLSIAANGVTYLPNLTPVCALSDGDFLEQQDDTPVSLSRTDPNDAKNVVILEVTSQDREYAYLPIPAWSQAAIENSLRKKIDSTITAHEIIGSEVGAIIAQILLQKNLYNRNSASLKLPLTFAHLDPMDIVTLTCPHLGYFTASFRVTSIQEDDSYDLTVDVDQIRLGVGTAVPYAKQVSTGGSTDTLVTPEPVNTPIIFEPSSTLAGSPQVWIAASGGGGSFDPNWGGCQVHISIDDDVYLYAGDITAACRMGTLTSGLSSYGGSNPDTGNTLYVDLGESHGSLLSGSSDDAQNARTLCYVDGELLSYEDATLASVTVTAEVQAVPSTAPYQIDVDHADTFLTNTAVTYAAGGALSLVGSNPGPGEYTVDDGLYTFNAADAGDGMHIDYVYASSYHYALDNLWRGQYETTAGSHSSGTKFARLDGTIFRFSLPTDYIGRTIYVKLVSYNIFHAALEDISTVTPYSYTPTGAYIHGATNGTHTVSGGEATAGTVTFGISCAPASYVSVTIQRSGVVVTQDADITTVPGTSGSVTVINGTTYHLTAGDIISWFAIDTTRIGGGFGGWQLGGGGGGLQIF